MAEAVTAVNEVGPELTLSTPLPAKSVLSIKVAPLPVLPQVPAALLTPPMVSVAAREVPLGRLSLAPLARVTLVVLVVTRDSVTVPPVLLMVKELTVVGRPLLVICAAVPSKM